MEILGQEISVKWQHLLIVSAVPLAIGLLLAAIGLAYGLLSGASDPFEALYGSMVAMSPIYSIIAAPLLAYLYLYGARLMKLGGRLSSSLAGAEFLVWGLGYAILAVLTMLILGLYEYAPLHLFAYLSVSFVNTLLNAFVASMLTYLWLLLFTGYDGKRLRAAAPGALLFSMAVFVAGSSLVHLLSASGLESSAVDFTMGGILFGIGNGFVFALPILYSFRRTGPWAYLFAFAFAVPLLSSILYELAAPPASFYAITYARELAMVIFQLGLLFMISRSRDLF